MPKSRLFAVLSLFVLSAVLVACGSDDTADPTAEPTATRSPVISTEVPGTPDEATVAPTEPPATPITRSGPPLPGSEADATPISATASASPVSAGTVSDPSPVTDVQLVPTEAIIRLEGNEQVDYVITDEGCTGIGNWRVLQSGTQVVVRDASGTVVDIGELEASSSGDGCSWVANVDVPESGFFSISIPMVADHWFDAAEVDTGTLDVTIPAN